LRSVIQETDSTSMGWSAKMAAASHARANPQTPQHLPKQNRRDGMQKDVDQVIAGGIEAPEMIFHPEGAEVHRIILRVRSHVEPDAV